jgi:hypothetical protein
MPNIDLDAELKDKSPLNKNTMEQATVDDAFFDVKH